jgi:HSP20 family protein
MFGLTRQNGETRLARPAAAGISRWDPWSEFNRIRQEMDNLFGGFVGVAPRATTEAFGMWAPSVDLYETADDIVLNAYLPGMSREDIHLEVLGSTIHLSGESKANIPDEGTTVHFTQGGYGRFDLRYRLPAEVSADQVKATYRNGVLEVRMPKAESAKPRAVEVQIEG